MRCCVLGTISWWFAKPESLDCSVLTTSIARSSEKSPITRPASAMSLRAARIEARTSSLTARRTRSIGVFIETLAFDLMPRSAASVAPACARMSGETLNAAVAYGSGFGHGRVIGDFSLERAIEVVNTLQSNGEEPEGDESETIVVAESELGEPPAKKPKAKEDDMSTLVSASNDDASADVAKYAGSVTKSLGGGGSTATAQGPLSASKTVNATGS